MTVRLSWYVGDSDLRFGKDAGAPTSDPPERFRPGTREGSPTSTR